jgi:IS5 family transposase
MIKTQKAMSFGGLYVERRTRKNRFFKSINEIIDWVSIDKEISKIYRKGRSVDGRPSYSGLLLFKMLLISYWYGLSDEMTEEMVNENLSAMMFCGLQIEDEVPDHSTLSRFRKELTEKKSFDRMLKKINKQLEDKKIKISKGKGIVDASITESPWQPKGKTTYQIAEDRKEDERKQEDIDEENRQTKIIKKKQPGVDDQARWVKKGKDAKYGYKKHILTDEEGLVNSVHTTTANRHDSKGLKPLVKRANKKSVIKGIFGDKAYKVPVNDEYLKGEKIRNRLQYKAYRNRPLSKWQQFFNKQVSKSRYVVERTFGGMKKWFGAGRARYKGLVKVHAQHVLEAIAYNLYRSPGLVWAKGIKEVRK